MNTAAFGLIVIGDEILSGKRADKHLPKVIELLAARGLALSWARIEGDDPQRITQTLRAAFAAVRAEGEVVFCCGGIGATPDDHTRQCAAQALDVPMAPHPQARASIIERMRELVEAKGQAFDPSRLDSEEMRHRFDMAVFPAGADIIPNPYNKIAGFSCLPAECSGDHRGGIHFVPGFPVMAWPMIEWVLDERYRHLHGAAVVRERSVIVYGGIEAALTPLMEAIEADFAGIKVFSLPSVDADGPHGAHVELGVKGLAERVDAAYGALRAGLLDQSWRLGPELVR